MATDSKGGISANMAAVAGARYAAKPGRESRPVVYVNVYDAMRFCNWLHNGAVAGADTEDGAYTLLGGTPVPSNGTTVERNPDARFTLPTEDEWYKAAYYDPLNAGADAGGNANYWLYPTMSDTVPYKDYPEFRANAANYDLVYFDVSPVGSYPLSVSYYGTFDQAGNVWEWNETISGSSRILRGGSWANNFTYLQSVGVVHPYATGPEYEANDVGFRIACP